ncbi:membrane peptidoglycan carboxypeptidase [Microbacterium endophyticum]|uniref:Membrane peptidoglycan carboxypeptidase n=1 Tax=Microbacterium endophyticum TaxID=1526412 RepID=A0A7W4YMI1_9MICO|nr:transglycosylase domain-containing protein [Microbacterium endophyticum]MBB2975142.1 membrane peptidoglycan carboxypeptidase [Microbacterium endophyticum]NIK37318.1 membrane peptidoglycan carboxypeptidase [Microbacterium endophyticum]
MPEKKRTASGVLGGLAGLVGLSVAAGVLITATITPAVAVTGAAASSAISMFENMPDYLAIDDLMLPSTIYTKDQATGEYTELTQFYEQNREPVTFDEIAPVMYDALLSSEDPRFYEHGGIDLIGTSRALLSNLSGSSQLQGGSSISQQYVKNVLIQRCESNATSDEEKQQCFTEATNSSGSDGIERKLQEMRYSIALEQEYSKNEILLGYLNIVNLGGTTYGVEAAAHHYFNVSAADLTLGQAAVIAGIVQNPNTYRIDMPGGSSTDRDGNPINSAEDGYSLTKDRQIYVLDRMLSDGKITQDQHDEAVAAPIEPNITDPTTGCAAAGDAAYFCQYVVSVVRQDTALGETQDERDRTLKRGGLNIYTTLDWRVQQQAQDSMNAYAPTSVGGMDFGSTAVSIEASTGRILAIAQNTKFSEDASLADDPNYTSLVYAGNSTYGNSDGFNAGSTFKLFTLVDWLEQGHSVNEVLDGRNRVFKTMRNSCTGDWNNTSNTLINNFNKVGGSVGTPMSFTAQSLNSGYLAMASELDLCDIANDATKMGVTRGDGTPITMQYGTNVIGSDNVSPIAMAGAYATIANNGTYCEPTAIDKVTNSDGDALKLAEKTCTQVLTPEVAATAAYALQGVMASSGTGSQGNPWDGTALIGKTGTHESFQTWMIESSTKVTTAVWVGNASGDADLFTQYANGRQLSSLRYSIARDIQHSANVAYGGDSFPAPDPNLIRTVYRDLPSVIGQSTEQAQQTLSDAGFTVTVTDAADGVEAAGTIISQSPGAGKVAGGTSVTITPSNGNGVSVPGVSGTLAQAQQTLSGAGLNPVVGTCTETGSASGEKDKDKPEDKTKTATGTDPAGGTVVARGATVSINYTAASCP